MFRKPSVQYLCSGNNYHFFPFESRRKQTNLNDVGILIPQVTIYNSNFYFLTFFKKESDDEIFSSIPSLQYFCIKHFSKNLKNISNGVINALPLEVRQQIYEHLADTNLLDPENLIILKDSVQKGNHCLRKFYLLDFIKIIHLFI